LSKPLSSKEIDEKRAGLIEAALSILETDGVTGLTLRRLAEAAGVSRQTPYLYFTDKAALCDAMCVAGMKRLTAATSESVAGAPSSGHVEQLRLAGEAYVRFGLENPALYALIFNPANLAEKLSAELQDAVDENISVSRDLMQKAWDDGLLAMKPERLNHVFWATMHGLISLRNDGLLSEDETFFQILADIEFILANGFLNKQ
jgi:AcrR family transcriptional regulator